VALSPAHPKVAVSTATGAFFNAKGQLEPGPFAVSYSPDGSQLAVRSSDGVGLAHGGRVTLLTPPGSNVVGFTWMPGSRLLLAEGPIPTGQLNAIDLRGRAAGKVVLSPSFGVGSGYGMAVDSTARHAVVTRAQVDTLGGAVHLDLVEVDLQTGAVRALTTTPDGQEYSPTYVDDQHVAYARAVGSRVSVALLDLSTLNWRDLTPSGESATPLGVVLQGAYVAYADTRGDVFAVDPAGGRPILLGSHVGTAVAVDPTGTRAVVLTQAGAATPVDQLVERHLTPPPKKSQ
jgi:hypothetical protein